MAQTFHDEHDDYADDDIEDGDDASAHDPEGPDPSEMDSSDDPDLEICPYCRKLINEDAERCHHCGNYLSAEDSPPLPKAAWFVIAVILALLVVLLVWIF